MKGFFHSSLFPNHKLKLSYLIGSDAILISFVVAMRQNFRDVYHFILVFIYHSFFLILNVNLFLR